MNYLSKRSESFRMLKSSQNLSDQQTIENGRYIIISNFSGGNYNDIEKNIKQSYLDYKPFSHKKVLKQRESINEVFSGKNIVIIEKTGLGIAELSSEELDLLKTNKELVIIPDRKISITKTESPSEEDCINLDSENMTYGLEMAKIESNSSFKGKNVKIAILDTGIDKNHPDLKNKIAKCKSWVDGDTDVQDKNGHGTHCAGIAVGGIDPNGKRYGVAPEATLYIGKILDQDGNGNLSNLLLAIDWAIEQKCNIISMSLSSIVHDIASDIIESSLFSKAYSNKIIMVAAAGNNSDHESNIKKPISNPAASRFVNAIGAIDKNGKIYNKSNGGDHPYSNLAYVAPGVKIYSSWLSENAEKSYKYLTGTSMATPFVAGILALTISKYNMNRRINRRRHRISVERLTNIINSNLFKKEDDWEDREKYGEGLPLSPKQLTKQPKKL